MTLPLDGPYRLILEPPSVDDYLRLRALSGLTPKNREQAIAGLPGSWAACHVVHVPSGSTVGMGRVLGDGGWYFVIADMAVLPEHQRQGLGAAVLGALLEKVRDGAPVGAWVTLMADPPGRRLYEQFGFRETAPHSLGMAQILTEPGPTAR
jgi:GNAT superfamily N-acetyltransferase